MLLQPFGWVMVYVISVIPELNVCACCGQELPLAVKTGDPSPQSIVWVLPGVASPVKSKRKFGLVTGTHLKKVVAPSKTTLGLFAVISALAVGFTVTAIEAEFVQPSEAVTVKVRFTTWTVLTGTG